MTFLCLTALRSKTVAHTLLLLLEKAKMQMAVCVKKYC